MFPIRNYGNHNYKLYSFSFSIHVAQSVIGFEITTYRQNMYAVNLQASMNTTVLLYIIKTVYFYE